MKNDNEVNLENWEEKFDELTRRQNAIISTFDKGTILNWTPYKDLMKQLLAQKDEEIRKLQLTVIRMKQAMDKNREFQQEEAKYLK